MAEAVGLLASIIAVLELSSKAVEYLSNVKSAGEERVRLQREIVLVTGLLTILRTKSEEWKDETWAETVTLLESPLEQTRELIQNILPRLLPGSGLKKIGKQLAWPFQKGEFIEIIDSLERYQRYFMLALQNDHIELSRQINATIADVRDDLKEVSRGVRFINERVVHMDGGIDGIQAELTGTRVDIREVKKGVLEIKDGVLYAQELQVRAVQQRRSEILDWVSPLRFAAKQKDVFQTRQDGTGTWFMEHTTFQEWIQGERNVLFCPGIPGGGKTVLASTVIDYLQRNLKDNQTAVAFVFCNYKEAHHKTTNLIGSILQQVAEEESDAFPLELPGKLIRLHAQYGKERPPATEFTKILKERLQFFKRVYIVVDALDECPEWDIFQQEVLNLATHGHGLRILVTSRPIKGIEDFFSSHARLAIWAKNADVREYLKGQISSKPRLAVHAKKDAELTKKIIDTIAKKARGMFLLAQLHINTVGSKHTVKKIREALECLPQGLDDTYNDAIDRIAAEDPEDYKLALQVFCWITYARSPLTLPQLQHAIAIERGMTELDQEDLLDQETLVALCAGLIKFDHRSNCVRLVHYTTHEFFERNEARLFPNAHTTLAATCITYLLFDAFDTFCSTELEMQERLTHYPFLSYTASHWGYHARKGFCKEIQDLIIQLVETEGKLATRFQVVRWKQDREFALTSSRWEEYHCDCNKLLVATWFGLEPLVKKYIKQGMNVNTKTWNELTPISIAAMRDFESIVRFLLEQKDIQLDVIDKRFGRTPLAWAATSRKNNTIIVLLLSREDVKPLINIGADEAPLSLAARSANEHIAKLLLAEEKIFPHRGDFLRPLLSAVQNRRMKVAQIILQHKSVDPNIRTRSGKTLLALAIENNDEAFVDLLLTLEGINLDRKFKGPWEWSRDKSTCALVFAVEMRSISIIRRLLTCGKPIDVNIHSPDGLEPLIFYAMDLGQIATVEMLLDHPSFLIKNNSHGSHGRLLLDHVIRATEKDSQDKNTTSSDSQQGDRLARKILTLQHGLQKPSARKDDITLKFTWRDRQCNFSRLVDIFLGLDEVNPDWRDPNGMTLLCQAASDGRADIVRLLLSRDDVDPNLPSNGSTPLAWACVYGHRPVVQLLVERADVTIDCQDTDLQTPFSWAARNGYEDIVDLLLAHGCKLDIIDKEGKTPLFRAIEEGHDRIARKILLKLGVETGL